MNTLSDVQAELDELAERAPSDADIRRDLAERIARHVRRRRVTTLVAAAAAVVVLAGGIGVARSVLSHRSTGPAGPTPVVVVSDVPLPADTKLIRHQLQPVASPVTVAPPAGLTGMTWSAYPGRLAVSWFDPGNREAVGSGTYSPTDGDTGSATPSSSDAAGYVITDAPADRLTLTDQHGTTTPTVQSRSITVGGRSATLQTAPQGTVDALGFPAEERLSWQLKDGRWIHVWVVGPTRDSSPTTALQSFAAGIVEKPQTLYRTIGVGFTLPGLTVDSSINYQPVNATLAGSVTLCPPDVDPLASSPDPTARCLVATVIRFSLDELDAPLPTAITVGDVVAHVDPATGRAMVELGDGLAAAVSAPGAGLSAADLAALVASVRLSPSATMLPTTPWTATGSGQQIDTSGQQVNTSGPATAVPSTAPSAGPSSVPASALSPSTTVEVPAAGLVAMPAGGLPIPFTLTAPADRAARIDWTVAPETGSAEITFPDQVVTTEGKQGVSTGRVQFDRSGLRNVPASATSLAIGGHDARMWTTELATTAIAWTLPDGTGLVATGSDEATARLVAGMIGTGSTDLATDLVPALVPQGLTVQRVEATADLAKGHPTAADLTAHPMTLMLCPAGVAPGTEADSPACLTVATDPASATTGVPPDGYQNWNPATVSGRTVFVSPDGRAVATFQTAATTPTWTTVSAGSTVAVTPGGLAAILLSISG